MLNNITLYGRLTRDPELRYTQSQKPVASFTVAVDRDFTPKDGGDKQTDFISCVAWSGTAEFVSKHFGKGQLILVNGRLQVREYTDKDGQNRKAYEVVCNNVYFGESKQKGEKQPVTRGVDVSAGEWEDYTEDDGDLPFD